eukprot:PhM_4_TR3048/c0_g1_i12/m.45282
MPTRRNDTASLLLSTPQKTPNSKLTTNTKNTVQFLLVISPVGHIVNTVVLAAMEETADRHTLISLMAVRAAVALAAAVAAAAPWRGYGRAAHTAACVAEMVVLTLLCTLVQGRVAGFVCALALVPYRAVGIASIGVSSLNGERGNNTNDSTTMRKHLALVLLGVLCSCIAVSDVQDTAASDGSVNSDEVPTWLSVCEALLVLLGTAGAHDCAGAVLVGALPSASHDVDGAVGTQRMDSFSPQPRSGTASTTNSNNNNNNNNNNTSCATVEFNLNVLDDSEMTDVTSLTHSRGNMLGDAAASGGASCNPLAAPREASTATVQPKISTTDASVNTEQVWPPVDVPVVAQDLPQHQQQAANFEQSFNSDKHSRPSVAGLGSIATVKRISCRPFASALTIKHLTTGSEALWQLDAAVMFVDISGYSSVAHVLGDRGPHVFAGVVNSFLEIIVNKVREYGGDVVKFSGDALMVMWYSDQPRSNARAAASCAVGLLNSRCAAHPVEDTELTFGLHVGISAGTVISHIFAPRASTKDLTTPSHFHFLTGDPVPTVSIACGIAKRGEAAITVSAAELIGINDITTSPTADPAYLYLLGTGKQVRLPCPTKSAGSTLAKLVMPPPIISRVTAGINPFYLAEMRDLVVLFIHLGVDTDEQIWFD